MEERPGDDRPQLPPPSLWPVGFAVGVVCLLVGLVVSWPVAAVGAAIALVFGFLWARDVDGPARPRPPRAARARGRAASARAGDRASASRAARFLEGATLGLGAVIGAIVTLPAVGLRAPARVPQAEGARGRPRPDLRLRGGQVEGRHLRPRPDQGRDHAPHRVHPQQRPARRRPELHGHLEPLRAPRLPGAARRAGLREGREDDQDRQRRRADHAGPAGGRLHLPVPRRLVRPGGQPHRRPAGPRARPLRVRHRQRPPDPRRPLQRREGRGLREDRQDREGTSCTARASTSTGPESWLYPLQPPH